MILLWQTWWTDARPLPESTRERSFLKLLVEAEWSLQLETNTFPSNSEWADGNEILRNRHEIHLKTHSVYKGTVQRTRGLSADKH